MHVMIRNKLWLLDTLDQKKGHGERESNFHLEHL